MNVWKGIAVTVVALAGAETARADYLGYMQVSNPQSPFVIYPRSTVIETRVKSVSPVGRNAALVRFDTVRRDAAGVPQPPQAWVAVIRYRYTGEPMKLEDRFVNPLGFQVLRYRRDAETLPPETSTTTTTTTVVAPAPVVVPSTTNVNVITPGAAGVGAVGAGAAPNQPPYLYPGGASPLGPAARAAAARSQARRAAEPPL